MSEVTEVRTCQNCIYNDKGECPYVRHWEDAIDRMRATSLIMDKLESFYDETLELSAKYCEIYEIEPKNRKEIKW